MIYHFFHDGFFTQDYICKFKVDEANNIHDKEFLSVDHFMIFIKDVLYNECNNSENILKEEDPKKIYEYEKVIDVDQEDWDKIEKKVSLYGNLFKFFQNPWLLNELSKTDYVKPARNTIVYCSLDTKWGIGLDYNDPACPYPDIWLGKNWLGQNLMEVRKMLMKYMPQNSSLKDSEKAWQKQGFEFKNSGGKIADRILDKMGKAFRGRTLSIPVYDVQNTR